MKAGGLVAVMMFTLAACSRSGSISGDVIVPRPPGPLNPAAHIKVNAIPSTAAFERDWTSAIAGFLEEVEPFRQAQKSAARSVEEARMAWDKALAARISAGSGARRPHKAPRPSARGRPLWNQLLEAERSLSQAKRRVWEVARKHDRQAVLLIDKYAAQIVQTDDSGHYVLAGLPAGKTYLYTRVTVGDRTLVWFRSVDVGRRAQTIDLTEANTGGWPVGQ